MTHNNLEVERILKVKPRANSNGSKKCQILKVYPRSGVGLMCLEKMGEIFLFVEWIFKGDLRIKD